MSTLDLWYNHNELLNILLIRGTVMAESYNRHDISDELWNLIEPHTIGNKGTRGGKAKDTRLFINAVFWILRTGAPWRDLPPTYGNWNNVNRRFCRWRDKDIWERIFLAIIGTNECEWLLIDASFVKAHKHAHGAIGGSKRHRSLKRGANSKIHLSVDETGRPVRVIITAGTINDCTKAEELTEDIEYDVLIADRGYDTNAIVDKAKQKNAEVVIPSKRSRKIQREHDKEKYKTRHIIENIFATLKEWRGIATRYAKYTKSYLAAVQIACFFAWGKTIVDRA